MKELQKRLRIAVSCRALISNGMEGIGWFTFETFKRIALNHPEVDFYFIFDRPFDNQFIFSDNITPIVIGPPSRHPILWYIWFEFSVKKILNEVKPNIFVSPDGYLPLNTKFKTLSIIHDIAYMHFPETVGFSARMYYRYFFPKFANQANRIGTVSNFSKGDISNTFKLPIDKIDVFYNGYNQNFKKCSDIEASEIKDKFANGKDFFICVGGTYPRKNLKRFIEAFHSFKLQTKTDIKLLIVGKIIQSKESLVSNLIPFEISNDIIFTGRINEFNDLNNLISSSIALCYISIFEGFGVPCLEAMACGTALIASNVSSIPEVCGKAAFYINPFETVSITNALIELFSNPIKRSELIEEGKNQLKNFSWDISSSLLWESILKTINS